MYMGESFAQSDEKTRRLSDALGVVPMECGI